jgi:hypothetical protein
MGPEEAGEVIPSSSILPIFGSGMGKKPGKVVAIMRSFSSSMPGAWISPDIIRSLGSSIMFSFQSKAAGVCP